MWGCELVLSGSAAGFSEHDTEVSGSMQVIYWLAQEVLPSQDGLWCIESGIRGHQHWALRSIEYTNNNIKR
jgi:hypothetical protein